MSEDSRRKLDEWEQEALQAMIYQELVGQNAIDLMRRDIEKNTPQNLPEWISIVWPHIGRLAGQGDLEVRAAQLKATELIIEICKNHQPKGYESNPNGFFIVRDNQGQTDINGSTE